LVSFREDVFDLRTNVLVLPLMSQNTKSILDLPMIRITDENANKIKTNKAYMCRFIFSFVYIRWFGFDLDFMVINATFNYISVILWRSVLFVEETGVSGENHQPVTSY
jgi:hypothetical protein